MKPFQFLSSAMLLACLLSAHQSKSQTTVNVVQSIPLTIAKVTTPVSVTVTNTTYTYAPVYLTEAQLDDQPTITSILNKMSLSGFELVNTTSYLQTSTGAMRFLLIFKKPN
jgi:hypothetical protein